MQFFNRPGGARIALRGSSSPPPTSEQLLSRAKAVRDRRAHHRRQQLSAQHIQLIWRRRLALHACANHFVANPASCRTRLLQLQMLAGMLGADECNSVRDNVMYVDRVVDITGLKGLSLALARNVSEHDCQTEEGVVRVVVLLLALTKRELVQNCHNQHHSLTDCVSFLRCAVALSPHLTTSSLEEQAHWGLLIHLSRLISHLMPFEEAHVELTSLLSPLINLTFSHMQSQSPVLNKFSLLMYVQFASTVLSIENVIPFLPLSAHPHLVDSVFVALSHAQHVHNDDSFTYVKDLVERPPVMLANLLEIGAHICTSTQNPQLWPFLSVISTHIHHLPSDFFLSPPSESPHMSHPDLLSRLSSSLSLVVSEPSVRNIFTTAVSHTRDNVISVCRLFSALLHRHHQLTSSFHNALAFWPRPSDPAAVHILNTLWNLCKKNHTSSSSSSSSSLFPPSPPFSSSSSPASGPSPQAAVLAEDASPILSIFASTYAYLLYIQDADDILDAVWPFSINDVREISLTFKHYLFSALYPRTSISSFLPSKTPPAALLTRERNLLDDVSRLLSRLHACDQQRPFRTGDDFWLAGRSLLASDAFLQDAINAGPQALMKPAEDATEKGVGQTMYMGGRNNSASGAGELLRVAPYLVPFSSRAIIFQTWIREERSQANGGRSFFPSMGRTVSVRRKYIFEDAFQELNGLEARLKSTIRVKFIDEHGIEELGIDGGGVFKEFMYEVLRLGFSPFSYGLFKATPDERLYPNPDSPIANENFKTQFAFLGRLLGKAVFDGVIVNIPLARFFLSKMLGHFNYPTDLGSLDPEVYKNLKFLKSCAPSMVEDLGLNFTVVNNAYGTAKEVELVRNGRNISVTAANRIEYILLVSNYRMTTQIKDQSEAFLKGFSEVVPSQFIRLFSQEELQLLISGKSGNIDLDDLKKNTKYSGGYSEGTPVIRWFWQAMSEFGAEDQGKMLQFVTSSPRAPLLGFSYLIPSFCIHRAEGEVRLPTASTCMNLLKLPKYKSLDIVREKLRYAIESNAGFDLS